MKKRFNFLIALTDLAESEAKEYKISFYTSTAILLLPFLIITFFFYGLMSRFTNYYFWLLCQENYPVEMLTFIFLILSSFYGIKAAAKMRRQNLKLFAILFIYFFVILMFLVAMEEIAWGQQLLKFQTPEYFKEVNAQNELTLHNVKALQGHSDFFRFFFGVAGLIGILFYKVNSLKDIAVPKILIGIFISITLISVIDIYNDYIPIQTNFDNKMRWMSEVIEMMIGIAAFLYMWLLDRKIKYNSIEASIL